MRNTLPNRVLNSVAGGLPSYFHWRSAPQAERSPAVVFAMRSGFLLDRDDFEGTGHCSIVQGAGLRSMKKKGAWPLGQLPPITPFFPSRLRAVR